MTKTTLYFPLEGTLRQDIKKLLLLSDGAGGSLSGKDQEWLDQAKKVVIGLRASLTDDGKVELAEL